MFRFALFSLLFSLSIANAAEKVVKNDKAAPAEQKKAEPAKDDKAVPAEAEEIEETEETSLTDSKSEADETGKEKKVEEISAYQIRKWLKQLTAKEESDRREAAANLISAREYATNVMKTKTGLRRYSTSRRMACIPILKAIKNKDAKIMLARRAVYDKKKDIRLAAAKAINELGSKNARAYVVKRAVSPEFGENTQSKAVRAIANIADKKIMPEVIEAMALYQGQVQINNMSLTSTDVVRERTERRWARVGGAGNAAVVLPVDLPYSMPQQTTTRIATTVVALFTGTGTHSVNPATLRKWWDKHGEAYQFPNFE